MPRFFEVLVIASLCSADGIQGKRSEYITNKFSIASLCSADGIQGKQSEYITNRFSQQRAVQFATSYISSRIWKKIQECCRLIEVEQ
jgi:hypothetical protein